MPLFEVDQATKRVSEIEPTTFPVLKLWERQDLEAWVLSAPELAGGGFTVVTSEYDRFDKTQERLDIIGLVPVDPGRGRLVVVELKRDGTSTTVDLQAIKYAAYVAAAQFADVAEMYSQHHDVPLEEAQVRLYELLGGSDDDPPVIDDTPRIILVAGDFRAEVTTTVLWLIDNFEMDIRCVRLQPFVVAGRTLVHSEVIIPLPEADEYRLGVQRKRRDVEREQEKKARAGRLLPRLVKAGLSTINQPLYFRRASVPLDATVPWSQDAGLYRATLINPETNRNLEWVDPQTGETLVESPSLLATRVLHALGLRQGPLSSAGVDGMYFWTTDGETSLRDLAEGLGDIGPRHIDRDALRAVCGAIPEGRWTTYGDVAAAIGVPGAGQPVASVIASDLTVPNAHRVLRKGGAISPRFRAAGGGGPEVARERLEKEGVTFNGDEVAGEQYYWAPPLPPPAGQGEAPEA